MSGRPHREATPSRKTLEIRASQQAFNGNRGRSRVLETPVPSRPSLVDAEDQEDNVETPSTLVSKPVARLILHPPQRRAARITFTKPDWAKDIGEASSAPPALGLTDEQKRQLIAQAFAGEKLRLEREHTAEMARLAAEGGGEEDDEDGHNSDLLDEDKEELSRFQQAKAVKRGRAATVVESVEDDALPPPSAQPEMSQNKRRKATKAQSQLDAHSPAPGDVFSLDKAVFNVSVQVLVLGKLLYTKPSNTADFNMDSFVERFQVELEQGLYSGPLWEVKKPTFGPEFLLNVSNKVSYRSNIGNEDDWVRFCTEWWAVRARASVAVTVKIPFTVNPVPPVTANADGAANLDSTQTRRAIVGAPPPPPPPPPSATQRQRNTNAARAEIKAATGSDLSRLLVTRWKCQVRNCKNAGYTCWPGDDSHIMMDAVFLRKWVQAIQDQDGGVTIDNPPAQLLVRLLKDREKAQTSKKAHRPVVDGAITSERGGHVYISLGGDASAMGRRATSPIVKEPPSSPPNRPGNDDDNMGAYMDWLSMKYPRHDLNFQEFKLLLDVQGWGFRDLKKITESQWDKMGVAGGFVAKIKSNMRLFSNEVSDHVVVGGEAS